MIRIGLLSDTHGFLDDAIFTHFNECDEVWHAGDFGNLAVADALAARASGVTITLAVPRTRSEATRGRVFMECISEGRLD